MSADISGPIAPPYWVATVPLPVGQEMGNGCVPVRAFSPGDRVPAEHVVRFGWEPYVTAPEGDWPVPEPAGNKKGD